MKKKQYVCLSILVILSIAISMQNVCSPVSLRMNYSDGSIYQYIGHLIRLGKMPYVDAFDHKGPILYLINALSLSGGTGGIWFVDMLCIVFYSFTVYFIATRFVKSGWALLVSAMAVTGLANTYWIGNTPDWYCTIATLFSMYLFVEYFQNGVLSKKAMLGIGISVAFCFWQKYTTIVVIGVYCLWILISDYLAHRNDKIFRINCALYCFLGFCLVSIPVIFWLWHGNALTEMVKDYFMFSATYGTNTVTRAQQGSAFLYYLSDPLICISLGTSVLYLFGLWILKSPGLVRKEELVAEHFGTDAELLAVSITALLLQAAMNAVTGRSYQQYKSILYPCAIVAICIFLKFLVDISLQRRTVKRLVFLIAAVLMVCNFKTASNRLQLQGVVNTEHQNAINIIKANSSYGSLIAVASPDHCGLYLWTGTESATTFPYIQAGMYSDQAFWENYNEQLYAYRPKVIVWANNWNIETLLWPNILERYETNACGSLTILVEKQMNVN